jgi:hypothetical protein
MTKDLHYVMVKECLLDHHCDALRALGAQYFDQKNMNYKTTSGIRNSVSGEVGPRRQKDFEDAGDLPGNRDFKQDVIRIVSLLFQAYPECDLPQTSYLLAQISAKTGLSPDMFVSKKWLHSRRNCREQHCHVDFWEHERDARGAVYLSIVVALEHHTHIILHDMDGNRFLLQVPKGAAVIFTNYCRHAGGKYDADNLRLFLSTGDAQATRDCGKLPPAAST